MNHTEDEIVPTVNAQALQAESEEAQDIVEETSMESFPASDPPSWNRGRERRKPATSKKSA